MRIRGTAIVVAAALCVVVHTPAMAQRVVTRTLLPDSTIARVINLYNHEQTTRFTGESRLAAGITLSGDVASVNGMITIGGRVTGDVVAINGDVHLLQTAIVDGTVTAVGGGVQIDSGAVTTGSVTGYREALRFREDNGVIAYVPIERESEISAGYDFAVGRTDIMLSSGAYNRTEGLPISVGPRGTFGNSNPTRIRALLTYRTANRITVDPDEYGYFVGVEQYVAGSQRIALHASLFREVRPIDDAGLRDREASLAAFVLHRDYRDHFDRRGWSAGVRFAHPGLPYGLGLEYRSERNHSVGPADPFSILDNDDSWPPQPLIAEGDLSALVASFDYDTRNDVLDPADGWLVRSHMELGLNGSLMTQPASALPATTSSLDRFTSARFDVRRYARLSPYARLSARAVLSGSLDGGPLPPQRQQTLGGIGTLPGFGLKQFDCGARDTTVIRGATEFVPYHGCDRLALVQLEFQASFPFARKVSERLRLGNFLTHSVRWSAFFDAGHAWTETDATNGRTAGDNTFSADAGLGLRLGALGIYYAVPLSSPNRGNQFFIRLGPRL